MWTWPTMNVSSLKKKLFEAKCKSENHKTQHMERQNGPITFFNLFSTSTALAVTSTASSCTYRTWQAKVCPLLSTASCMREMSDIFFKKEIAHISSLDNRNCYFSGVNESNWYVLPTHRIPYSISNFYNPLWSCNFQSREVLVWRRRNHFNHPESVLKSLAPSLGKSPVVRLCAPVALVLYS